MQASVRHAMSMLRPGATPGDFGTRRVVGVIVAAAPLAGAVIGAYALDSPERLVQVLYSALKLPLWLLATSSLCTPAYFVLCTAFGLRDDFRESLRAILSGQAVLTIVLASLAPVVAFAYVSGIEYEQAKVFNAVLFAVGTFGAQITTRRLFRPLIAARPAHGAMLGVWTALYVFVGVQMAWTLRPFIGHPGMPTTFFRSGAFTNAYVEVMHAVGRALHVNGPGVLR